MNFYAISDARQDENYLSYKNSLKAQLIENTYLGKQYINYLFFLLAQLI
jgi:hypothetical protein